MRKTIHKSNFTISDKPVFFETESLMPNVHECNITNFEQEEIKLPKWKTVVANIFNIPIATKYSTKIEIKFSDKSKLFNMNDIVMIESSGLIYIVVEKFGFKNTIKSIAETDKHLLKGKITVRLIGTQFN